MLLILIMVMNDSYKKDNNDIMNDKNKNNIENILIIKILIKIILINNIIKIKNMILKLIIIKIKKNRIIIKYNKYKNNVIIYINSIKN